MKLIEMDHGKGKTLKIGTLKEIVEHLQANENLCNWVLDENPEMELPNFGKIETIEELKHELQKVDLSWWGLKIED